MSIRENIIAYVLSVYVLKETIAKLKARNNSARVSGHDDLDNESPPAHRTNQIAGLGEFRPLGKKNNIFTPS